MRRERPVCALEHVEPDRQGRVPLFLKESRLAAPACFFSYQKEASDAIY